MAVPSKPASANSPSQTPAPAPRWGEGRRLEFIDFRLQWQGRLNRSDLTTFFGISIPQASLDIAKYTEMAPGNLEYDRRERVYVTQTTFRPLFPGTSNPATYLNELLAQAAGLLDEGASFANWRPPVAVVPNPSRALKPDIVVALLASIRQGGGLRTLYQSMSRMEPLRREFTPHALAHDGFRWHVRGFCHERKEFRDFVVARLLELEPAERLGPSAEDDVAWWTEVELVLAPHPKLSKAQQRAIELDYAMVRGEARLKCRRALLFYVLRHLGLDRPDSESPEAVQIVLKNRKTLVGDGVLGMG
jgi:hypothetical protein